VEVTGRTFIHISTSLFSERENVDNATWYKNHPYAEWYMNTYRIKGSPSREFHKKHFGKESYLDAFVPRFNQAISEWEPKNMAALFKSTGAKYAVLTSKVNINSKLNPVYPVSAP
jgi:alpha-L-fucosidase